MSGVVKVFPIPIIPILVSYQVHDSIVEDFVVVGNLEVLSEMSGKHLGIAYTQVHQEA